MQRRDFLKDSMPEITGNVSLSQITVNNSSKYKTFFSDVIEKMVSMSKDTIEQKANQIYDSLKDYKDIIEESELKLIINENYGMSLKSGEETLQPSAGGSQIVALSLIFALRDVLESDAPILMDTPMGRLDAKYRKGLLDVAPMQGTQFILLVHDGELTKDLYNYIRPKVGKEYKLVRHGDRHTEILAK